MFSNYYINKILKAFFVGEISAANLPHSLYSSISKHLRSGLNKGLGDAIDYKTPDQILVNSLHQNIRLFSGAKTFQYTLATEGLLTDDNNKLRSFSEFKKVAKPLFKKYNETWLKAEYDTCIGQASQVRDWIGFIDNKELMPMLEYVAAMDDRTSDICMSKDGIVLPVGHTFWQTSSPLSHFRCRCTIVSHPFGYKVPTSDLSNVIPAEGIFKQNPAFTGQIFDKSHPYFNIPGGYKAYAKNNFGLPINEL